MALPAAGQHTISQRTLFLKDYRKEVDREPFTIGMLLAVHRKHDEKE
jgi:hypothetical protein